MADVFISYARTERDEAERIKARLEAMGLSVFLDVDGLDGGDVFSEKLDREVKTAGCVLGLWSPTSLSRPWVQIECDIGKRRGVLVPAAIHPFRDMEVPAPFWNIQFVDLADLTDYDDDPNWIKLRKALARTLKRPDLAPAGRIAPVARDPRPYKSRAAPSKSGHGAAIAIGALLALLSMAGLGAGVWFVDPMHWRSGETKSQLPTVSATPSPGSQSAKPAQLAAAPPSSSPNPSLNPIATSVGPVSLSPADLRSPAALKTTPLFALPQGTIAYSRDGARIVSSNLTNEVKLYDARNGNLLRTLKATGRVFQPAFSRDGARIIAAVDSGNVTIWDAATGAVLQTFLQGSASLYEFPSHAVFTADGLGFITTGVYGTALSDARTGQRLSKFQDDGEAMSIAISRDGQLLAIGDRDGKINIWNIATAAKLHTISSGRDWLMGLAFTDGDKQIIGTNADGVARFFDTTTGQQVGKRLLHGGGVQSVSVSDDGSRIATSSTNGDFIVWDGATREELLKFGGGVNGGNAELSPDGTQLATVTSKSIKVMRLDPQ